MMRRNGFTRRQVMTGAGAAALSLASTRVMSAAPPASSITPELVEAAKKEGKVVYYTSIDLQIGRAHV